MKLMECVLDSYIREMVNIDMIQIGFVPGRGTTDTIFSVGQLQEKCTTASKLRHFAFVDLKKVFDRVPRKVLWRDLKSHMVVEWAASVIQGIYSDAHRLQVSGQCSDEFGVGVDVHRGLLLAHCSSSWCLRCFRMRSALVCRRSFSTLVTWCSWQTPRRIVSLSSRLVRQL